MPFKFSEIYMSFALNLNVETNAYCKLQHKFV